MGDAARERKNPAKSGNSRSRPALTEDTGV